MSCPDLQSGICIYLFSSTLNHQYHFLKAFLLRDTLTHPSDLPGQEFKFVEKKTQKHKKTNAFYMMM